MISYKIRSSSLLNLINDIRTGKLIPDAYFQRNLVWRDIHNKDFIKTILLGYPFPQIFISRGKVDVEKMATISCIVDGQQRTHAIISFVDGDFDVEGRFFNDLSEDEKSVFLKYDVAIIELDLDNNDPQVKEIFQRINRTSNSLTAIEKMASAYATSDFMLTAKHLCDEIDITASTTEEEFKEDPNIPKYFYTWAKINKPTAFQKLILEKGIFTPREISRKNHLMHVLNIISTSIGGFYDRNGKSISNISDRAIDFIPDPATKIVTNLNKVAVIITKIKFHKKSIYLSKTGFFSLCVALYSYIDDIERIDIGKLKSNLENFELNQPEPFKLAMSEGLNNKSNRQTRHDFFTDLIDNSF
ncbi:DUF262 domain-containing protein [Buttiauxella gaviniae]|uniref:DUF262 domain-containing protein n=1 Tax=Buttiauxella gaviniae TaxID=82990 RepID=UPI0039769B94